MYILEGGNNMQRTNVYLDERRLKQLEAIGKEKGLKVAQLIRLAIAEYCNREGRKTR